MKTSYKIILSSIIQYLTIGLILLASSSGLHEILHLRLTSLLGGDGYIILNGLTTEFIFTTQPSNMTTVASAGLIVALLYTLIAYIGYRKKFAELYTAIIPAIFIQLFYGAVETMFWQLPDPEYFAITVPVVIISALAGLALSIYLLYKDLKTRFHNLSLYG
jgi:hypothetical protein